MLADHFRRRQCRIAKFQFCNLQHYIRNTKLLHRAFAQWIRDNLMLHSGMQSARGHQVRENGIDLVHGRARFRHGPVVKRQNFADGVFQFRIREPRQIIKVSWNSWRLYQLERQVKSFVLRLKGVFDVRKEARLQQAIRAALQVLFSHCASRA